MKSLYLILLFFLLQIDVAVEKTQQAQQAAMKFVEEFDPSNLKHTKTQEKVVLPDKEGKLIIVN